MVYFFTAVIAIISFNINNIYVAVIDEVRFEGNKRILIQELLHTL